MEKDPLNTVDKGKDFDDEVYADNYEEAVDCDGGEESIWYLIIKSIIFLSLSVIMFIILRREFSGSIGEANWWLVASIILIIVIVNHIYAKNTVEFIKDWFTDSKGFLSNLLVYIVTFPIIYIYILIRQSINLVSNIIYLFKKDSSK